MDTDSPFPDVLPGMEPPKRRRLPRHLPLALVAVVAAAFGSGVTLLASSATDSAGSAAKPCQASFDYLDRIGAIHDRRLLSWYFRECYPKGNPVAKGGEASEDLSKVKINPKTKRGH